jgi:hypothetical protein
MTERTRSVADQSHSFAGHEEGFDKIYRVLIFREVSHQR